MKYGSLLLSAFILISMPPTALCQSPDISLDLKKLRIYFEYKGEIELLRAQVFLKSSGIFTREINGMWNVLTEIAFEKLLDTYISICEMAKNGKLIDLMILQD